MKAFTLATLLATLGTAHAGVTPSTMMANVYRFSEAGAVLEICYSSAAYAALPAERAEALRGLSTRLTRLVKAIGQYYEDGSVYASYEATRARIAGESRLKLHVKNHYEYCGEKLAADREKYVVENEALIAPVFLTAPTRALPRHPPGPPPVPAPAK